MAEQKIIPEKTIERLSEYRRTLSRLLDRGVTHVFSHTLARKLGITAVQCRRDFMLIGFSSDTKKGYDVRALINHIGEILDHGDVLNVAVIGMGHLGQAITKYFSGKRSTLKIACAFDVDPNKVNTTIDDIPCYDILEFTERVKELNITMVIMSSPAETAKKLVPIITEAGIQGVLNFTSIYLNFPPEVFVEDYDIITLLEKVAYFVKERQNSEKAKIDASPL